MATILRQPLYSPNRALTLKHDDPVQNLQQTTLKVVVALLPFFNADTSRPNALVQNRYDPIGTNYQQFLVPPATTPAINVWYSRPVQLVPRKDESAEKNYQLSPAVVATTPIVNADFSRPLNLSIRKDEAAQLFVRPSSALTNIDFGRPGILRSARDSTSGLNLPLTFPPPVTTPFVQPDLSARAQSPYSRVDGPLGSPLLITFPLPPSVLPFNTYDVSARAINLPIAGQDASGINLQLFTPISVVVPLNPEVPAGRPRRQREIYFVKIDGQTFECRSVAEAVELLNQAKRIAQKIALEQSRKATERKQLSVPELPLPKITVSSRDLRKAVTETQREIKQIYTAAKMDIEIAMLIELGQREKDNEDALWLLL